MFKEMLNDMAIKVLRKSGKSVIIKCNLEDLTVGIENNLLIYDTKNTNTTFIHKNGATFTFTEATND